MNTKFYSSNEPILTRFFNASNFVFRRRYRPQQEGILNKTWSCKLRVLWNFTHFLIFNTSNAGTLSNVRALITVKIITFKNT